MNSSTLNRILLAIGAKFEDWLFGCVVATLGAVMVWWATSSLAPLSVVALVVALVSSAVLYVTSKGLAKELAQRTRFLAKVAYPPVPVTLMYEFWLDVTERAWDALGLTPDECAAVKARATGSIGFVIEKWGNAFTRWRVREQGPGGLQEHIIDFHVHDEYETVGVWRVEFELGPDRPRVELAWRRHGLDGAPGESLTLAAFGGRFGGTVGHEGITAPAREVTLFQLHLPLDIPRASTPDHEHFAESTGRYRVRGTERWRGDAWVVAGESAGRIGCDAYLCDALADRGFRWRLVRRDCRRKFLGKVLKVTQGPASALGAIVGRVETMILIDLLERLQESGWTLWARAAIVEPDDTGRTIPAEGEEVFVAFDDNLREADRIWLTGFPKAEAACERPISREMPGTQY